MLLIAPVSFTYGFPGAVPSLMIGFLLSAFLAGLLFLLLPRLKGRQQNEKNDPADLAGSTESTESTESIPRPVRQRPPYLPEKEATGMPMQNPLAALIEGQQLYLDKNLSREMAATLLGISRNRIGPLLHDIRPGLSFPEYVNGLRIRHALELLEQNPDIPVKELADLVGFYSVRTLERSFAAVIGKTPKKYAKELKYNQLQMRGGAKSRRVAEGPD